MISFGGHLEFSRISIRSAHRTRLRAIRWHAVLYLVPTPNRALIGACNTMTCLVSRGVSLSPLLSLSLSLPSPPLFSSPRQAAKHDAALCGRRAPAPAQRLGLVGLPPAAGRPGPPAPGGDPVLWARHPGLGQAQHHSRGAWGGVRRGDGAAAPRRAGRALSQGRQRLATGNHAAGGDRRERLGRHVC